MKFPQQRSGRARIVLDAGFVRDSKASLQSQHNLSLRRGYHMSKGKVVLLVARYTAAAVLLAVTYLACQAKGQPGNHRQALIDRLVEKGDAAATNEDFVTATLFYLFASKYAPTDESISEKVKASLKIAPHGTPCANDSNSTSNFDNAMSLMNHAAIVSDWPQSTPEMQLAELRMLLDERIVGGFRSWPLLIQEKEKKRTTALRVFCTRPTITLDQIVEEYGQPSLREEGHDGWHTLTYGHVRIVANNNELKAVLSPYINMPSD
jgi:hypothetical protein